MKFEVTLETQIEVEFSDPEKAKAYFIDSDWKNYFYTFSDLAELSEHIAFAFKNTPKEWDKENKEFIKFIEGFGYFASKDQNWSVCCDNEFSDIKVRTCWEDDTSVWEQ